MQNNQGFVIDQSKNSTFVLPVFQVLWYVNFFNTQKWRWCYGNGTIRFWWRIFASKLSTIFTNLYQPQLLIWLILIFDHFYCFLCTQMFIYWSLANYSIVQKLTVIDRNWGEIKWTNEYFCLFIRVVRKYRPRQTLP